MPHIFIIIIFLTSLVIGEEAKPEIAVVPNISLFVVHDSKPENGSEVVTPSKSSKGFISKDPDLELPNFLEISHQGPKVLKRTPEGEMIFVDGEADLLLNLHQPESKQLAGLHKKTGEVRLYIRVTIGDSSRYFDAEFAPVNDSSFFVEGTAKEKAELAKLLRLLVTEPKKENKQ